MLSITTREKVIFVGKDAIDDTDVYEDGKEEVEEKKSRGSWTPEKYLVLLQKYAEYSPPGALWGKSNKT